MDNSESIACALPEESESTSSPKVESGECDKPEDDNVNASSKADLEETTEHTVNTLDETNPTEKENDCPVESDTMVNKEDIIGDNEAKEKDSDSCETNNDENESSAKNLDDTNVEEESEAPIGEILAPVESDNLDSEKREKIDDIYAMRKESLKNTYWDDSEDESEIQDPDLVNPQNKILWAAEKNEIEAVRQLLEEDPSLVNAHDEDGYTPLHRAAYNNHVEVIKLLLASNGNLSAKTEDEWEPLHCACKWESVEAASLLIQNGANVNATTKGGLTPLHLSASNPNGRRTLELLLWHPYVDPTIKSERGDTAYDTVCQNSPHYKLFEMIDISINCY